MVLKNASDRALKRKGLMLRLCQDVPDEAILQSGFILADKLH